MRPGADLLSIHSCTAMFAWFPGRDKSLGAMFHYMKASDGPLS
jgi:hypothetical protein